MFYAKMKLTKFNFSIIKARMHPTFIIVNFVGCP